MLGYVLLILLIFMIDNVHDSLNKKYNYAFIVLFIFTGFRYGIGYDYFSYYENIMGSVNTEPIPYFLMALSRDIHYSLFFIISSFFTNLFFIKGLSIRQCPYESIYLYIGLPILFFSSLSTVRQYLAISLIFFMICIKDAKLLTKLFIVVVAFLCHRSAIIAVLILFPFEKWFGRKSLFLLFIISILFGEMFVKMLLKLTVDSPFMINFINFLEMDVPGGFYKRIIVYLIVLIVLINYNYLINKGVFKKFLVLTVLGGALFALFSIQTHIAERFCTFFFSSILIYSYFLRRRYNIPLYLYKSICIFAFAMQVYIGHVTSKEVNRFPQYKESMFYPYETIFENNPEE